MNFRQIFIVYTQLSDHMSKIIKIIIKQIHFSLHLGSKTKSRKMSEVKSVDKYCYASHTYYVTQSSGNCTITSRLIDQSSIYTIL